MAGQGDIRTWQEDFYLELHQHPEVSHHENATARKVAERLKQAGFQVHSGVGGTGVVGALRNGDGPTVLLRAGMDALPVRDGDDAALEGDGVLGQHRPGKPHPAAAHGNRPANDVP